MTPTALLEADIESLTSTPTPAPALPHTVEASTTKEAHPHTVEARSRRAKDLKVRQSDKRRGLARLTGRGLSGKLSSLGAGGEGFDPADRRLSRDERKVANAWLREVRARLRDQAHAQAKSSASQRQASSQRQAQAGGGLGGRRLTWSMSDLPRGGRLEAQVQRLASDIAVARFEEARAIPLPVDDLPVMGRSRRWGRRSESFGGHGGMWGPINPILPAHITSTGRAGVLTPFVAANPYSIPGPVIGVEHSTGMPFTFDPWGARDAGLVNSPNMVVFGLVGYGKSTHTKVLAVRLMQWGRKIIVASDPKSEWTDLARLVGGQIMTVGPGTGTVLNLLDVAPYVPGSDELAWVQDSKLRRDQALRAVCYAMGAGDLDAFDKALIDALVVDMTTGGMPATLRACWQALEDDGGRGELSRRCNSGQSVSRLAKVFQPLVSGAFAGMFDTHSTMMPRANCPMTVIDTSAVFGSNEVLTDLMTAARSAWIDATLKSRDGAWRTLINEEAHFELRNKALAESTADRLRLSGHYQVGTINLLHQLEDTFMVGDQDSAHRAIVKGIIKKSDTKVLYRQDSESIGLLREFIPKISDAEAEELPHLPPGVGFWHLSENTPVKVHPVVGERLYQTINTDKHRSGGFEK